MIAMMRSSPLNPATFRDRGNLILARASEIGAPCLKIAARLSSRGGPTPPDSWRRGILIGADHIGDVLYNTASLSVLAEAFPNCEWNYLVTPPADEVLANNPSVKNCVPSLASLGPIDVAICYNSGGYWRNLVEATRQGIPNRVGYVHKGFSALVTHPVQINYPQPFPAYFRDLVAQLINREPTWPLRPKVFPSAADEIDADELWRELRLDSARPVIACFVTSRQSRGVLPLSKLAEAIREVERQPDVQTVLLGASGDQAILTQLRASFHLRGVIAAGRLRLLPLVCFLRKCAMVFSTDSGPRHLANAAGLRVVYVRNLFFNKVEAGRYCETEVDLAPDVELVAPERERRTFSDLDPAQIANVVLKCLPTSSR